MVELSGIKPLTSSLRIPTAHRKRTRPSKSKRYGVLKFSMVYGERTRLGEPERYRQSASDPGRDGRVKTQSATQTHGSVYRVMARCALTASGTSNLGDGRDSPLRPYGKALGRDCLRRWWERVIVLRSADSLALGRFMVIRRDEFMPDHSTISHKRWFIGLDTHREVFGLMLREFRGTYVF